jgi:hypothetical protein
MITYKACDDCCLLAFEEEYGDPYCVLGYLVKEVRTNITDPITFIKERTLSKDCSLIKIETKDGLIYPPVSEAIPLPGQWESR